VYTSRFNSFATTSLFILLFLHRTHTHCCIVGWRHFNFFLFWWTFSERSRTDKSHEEEQSTVKMVFLYYIICNSKKHCPPWHRTLHNNIAKGTSNNSSLCGNNDYLTLQERLKRTGCNVIPNINNNKSSNTQSKLPWPVNPTRLPILGNAPHPQIHIIVHQACNEIRCSSTCASRRRVCLQPTLFMQHHDRSLGVLDSVSFS
jgi:hypothetical protein